MWDGVYTMWVKFWLGCERYGKTLKLTCTTKKLKLFEGGNTKISKSSVLAMIQRLIVSSSSLLLIVGFS